MLGIWRQGLGIGVTSAKYAGPMDIKRGVRRRGGATPVSGHITYTKREKTFSGFVLVSGRAVATRIWRAFEINNDYQLRCNNI